MQHARARADGLGQSHKKTIINMKNELKTSKNLHACKVMLTMSNTIL
jgi:hypothetical protein